MTIITGSDREIEYLLKREFPGYSAVQPQPITRHALHVPTTPEQEQAREALRQRTGKRRSELVLLKLTASDEFARLVAAEYAKEAQAAEEARPFNQPHARADFDHWGKLAYWSLDESITLCFGRDPRIVNWETIRTLVEVSPFAKQFAAAREIAMRARGVNEIAQSNIPGPFIAWAKRVGLPFPAKLEAKVAERGPIADWHNVYEQEHANHQRALARIAELERELGAAQQANTHHWPWGTYETELLRALAAAVERYWVKYDATEPSTANNSDDVAKWLRTQKVKNKPIAARVAEIMAQIIRADGLRTGPR